MKCDASTHGIGAMLLQSNHPIAYFSNGFSFSNRFKSTYNGELFPLVLALQKWRYYLLGRNALFEQNIRVYPIYWINESPPALNKGFC